MSSVNPITREVLLKVVYYGPGLGGKTTSLQYIHSAAKPEHRGKMVSLATPVDRTLYFDFLPVRLPRVRGYTIRLQLFTVPGQVYYNATRKLVLTGADGIVFVADSQRERQDANVESLENLKDNLREHGVSLEAVPHVFEYNKRDLPSASAREDMDRVLNELAAPVVLTVATSGEGIFEALEAMTRAVLRDLREKRVLWADDEEPLASRESFLPREEGIVQTLIRASDASGAGSAPPPAAAPVPPPATAAPAPAAAAAQPLIPTPARRPPSTGASLFTGLFGPEEEESVLAIENALAAGDIGRAVEACEPAATRELALAAASTGESAPRDPSLAAFLLGVDGRRYLRFRSICRKQKSGEALEARDAMYCYLFVLDLRLRRIGL